MIDENANRGRGDQISGPPLLQSGRPHLTLFFANSEGGVFRETRKGIWPPVACGVLDTPDLDPPSLTDDVRCQ